MDSIIQKAAKGNRGAMTALYNANVKHIYTLAGFLLCNAEQAASATAGAIKAAFQATAKDDLRTEAEFAAFAVKQAASLCRKELSGKDSRAFRLPPQKDFHLTGVDPDAFKGHNDGIDAYIRCLPPIQRFALVLRLSGNMDPSQLSRTIGLERSAISLVLDAEPDNLEKIRRAAEAAGVACCASTQEALQAGFADAQARTQVPEELNAQLTHYIDTVASPAEAAAKNRAQKIGRIAVAAVLCAALVAGIFWIVKLLSPERLDPNLTYYADIVIEDYGTVTVKLEQDTAPITCANFVELAQSGFYDGLTFHRIKEGFMMQGGDPEGNGTGNSGKHIKGEFSANGYNNPLSHTRGAVSMARSDGYNSASCQFFIVHKDSITLDGGYAVFGYVTEGMDVVDAVCEDANPTNNNGAIAPEDQPVITSITIRTEDA